jgi:Amino acid permease
LHFQFTGTFWLANSPKVEVRWPIRECAPIFIYPLVVQELGREGVVPFSSQLASNKPWGAPLTGLLVQYVISCTFLFFVPPGDAYYFMISCENPFFVIVHFNWSLPSHRSI